MHESAAIRCGIFRSNIFICLGQILNQYQKYTFILRINSRGFYIVQISFRFGIKTILTELPHDERGILLYCDILRELNDKRSREAD